MYHAYLSDQMSSVVIVGGCDCLLRAVINPTSMKPITEAPDVSDLKNESSKKYAEAVKELALHQRMLKPQSESSKLQPTLLDREVCVSSFIFLFDCYDC